MIISKRRKFVFVQVPHTASTAIGDELLEKYGGEKIFNKHTSIAQFFHWTRASRHEYLVFATVRNPMDEAVTKYFRLKTNHRGKYTNARWHISAKDGGWVTDDLIERFNYINETNACFSDYFKRFYGRKFCRKPYSNKFFPDLKVYSYILRFENINEDYLKMLALAGLQPVRSLPIRNTTSQRHKDFLQYYDAEAIILAKRIFGPYMKKFGYKL